MSEVTVETYTAENGGGGGVSHALAREVGTRLGTRYVAVCGASAYNLRQRGQGTVRCPRCAAKLAREETQVTGCVRLDAQIERARNAGVKVEVTCNNDHRYDQWQVVFTYEVGEVRNALDLYRSQVSLLVFASRSAGAAAPFRLSVSKWSVADATYNKQRPTMLPYIVAGMLEEAASIAAGK